MLSSGVCVAVPHSPVCVQPLTCHSITQYTCLSTSAMQGLYLPCLTHPSHTCHATGSVTASRTPPCSPEVHCHTGSFTCMTQPGNTLFYDNAWARGRFVPSALRALQGWRWPEARDVTLLETFALPAFYPLNLVTSELSQGSD